MKRIIKKIFRTCGLELIRYRPHSENSYEQIVSLKPERESRGNVLLSYILEPFLLKSGEPVPNTHNHYWRSLQMANTFLELGYSVDVIDYRNRRFIPKKNYAIFIDVRHNLERLSPFLNKDCLKIMHIDHAHILFHNFAEAKRLLELQQRKGFTLRPRRFEVPNLGIEHADCATITGNEFNLSTFRYANKPIYRLPQPCNVYPWPEDKDYQMSRKSFLWFNSGGLVHKGLDLVLEAFAEMQDFHLYVCGPIQKEKDFEKVYHKELYETANIHMIGWVDIDGSEFTEITKKCLGVILASCSEGGGASVITCMHAGLIPIVSYESSVDVHDFGVILNDCSIDTIKKTVQTISALPSEELKNMARKAWEYARANHTRERFSEEFKKVITHIIEMNCDKSYKPYK